MRQTQVKSNNVAAFSFCILSFQAITAASADDSWSKLGQQNQRTDSTPSRSTDWSRLRRELDGQQPASPPSREIQSKSLPASKDSVTKTTTRKQPDRWSALQKELVSRQASHGSTPPPVHNGLKDGGFEMGMVVSGEVLASAGSECGAWRINKGTVHIEQKHAPYEGHDSLDLGGGVISQTVATIPGHRYLLTLRATLVQSRSDDTRNVLSVRAGTQSEECVPDANGWSKCLLDFTASSPSTTIELSAIDSARGLLIDEVELH